MSLVPGLGLQLRGPYAETGTRPDIWGKARRSESTEEVVGSNLEPQVLILHGGHHLDVLDLCMSQPLILSTHSGRTGASVSSTNSEALKLTNRTCNAGRQTEHVMQVYRGG